MRVVRMVVVMALVMAASTLASVGSVGAQTYEPVTITGLVVTPDGEPVEGAEIQIEVEEFDTVATTGTDGSFTFEWYEGATASYRVRPPEPWAVQTGEYLADPAIPLEITLEPGSSVSGRLTSKDGRVGLPGIYLALFPESTSPFHEAVTGDDGSFLFTQVPAGSYTIHGWTIFPDDANGDPVSVEVTAGVDVTGVGAFMNSAVLTGQVTDDAGQPIAGAEISASAGAFNSAYAYGVTDASGRYRITVSPFDYVVQARASLHRSSYYDGATNYADATTISPADGDTITADFVLDRLAVVSGRTVDVNGTAIEGASVQLIGDAGFGVAWTSSDADGFFELGAEPGTYTVAAQRWPDLTSESPVAIVVETVAVDVGDLTLVEAGSIAGTVFSRGAPRPGTSLALWPVGADDPTLTSYSTDGTFRFDTVAPGDYQIEVYANETSWYGGASRSEATVVTVGSGEDLTDIDIDLGSPGGRLTGTITDDAGQALGGIHVEVQIGNRYFGTSTDAEGQYELVELPAGLADIEFSDPGGRHATQWWDRSYTESGGTPLRIDDGDDTLIDVVMPEAGWVEVSLVDGGAPFSDWVSFYDGDGRYLGQHYVSSTSDYPVPPGIAEVYLRVYNDGRAVWYPSAPSRTEAETVPITVGEASPAVLDVAAPETGVDLTVADGDGQPVDAWVEITTPDGFYRSLDTSDSAIDLEAGDYSIWVGTRSGVFVDQLFAVTVPDAGRTTLSVVLEEAPIQGTIVDTSGTPIENIYVRLGDENGFYIDAVSSDSLGRFGFETPAGEAYLRVEAFSPYASEWFDDLHEPVGWEAPVPLAAIEIGTLTLDAPIEIVLEERGTIQGRVVDADGNPLEGIRVYHEGSWHPRAETSDDGTFTIRPDIDPGVLRAEDPTLSYATTNATDAGGAPIEFQVGPGEVVDGVEIVMIEAATIAGRVIDDQGNPLPGAIIRSGTEQAAISGPDGVYELRGLRPGLHVIGAFSPTGRFVDTWWDSVEAEDLATSIQLAEAEYVDGIDFVARSGAELTGRFVDGAGNPVGGIVLDGGDEPTASDENGDFVAAVRAGTIDLLVTSPDGSFAPVRLSELVELPTFVAGETLTLGDVRLDRCDGRVVNVFLDEGDQPTESDDVILGTEGDDTIDALGGDDLVCSLGGDDTVDTGDGDDIVLAGDGDDIVTLGAGNDIADGGDGVDRLEGGPGMDYLGAGTGGASPERLDGGDDADWLDGSWSSSVLLGGDGADVVIGGPGADDLEGGAGDDVLWAGDGDDFAAGGDGDDVVHGVGGDDSLDGGDGNDIVVGNDGDDTITGGAGLDYLWGGTGADTIDGGADDDRLEGWTGDDILDGGDGDDVVLGFGGNDSLRGGAGADYLWGGLGIDVFDGGADDDHLEGHDDGEDLGETMVGGAGDDTLLGWGGDDTLWGDTAGDPTDGDGSDYLWGGAGADQLDGGGGTNRCDGDLTDPPATNCAPLPSEPVVALAKTAGP